jgi:hypothetical protein
VTAELQSTIRRLAELDAGEMPFLSIYLDVRPEATGQRPQVRAGLTFLRDRMREIRKTLLPRGEDLESFDADAERVEAFVTGEMEASTEGLAIFACNAYGVFEVVQVGTPFEQQVTAAAKPDLYQLARLVDEYETSVVGVVDTNTARLFVYRRGSFREVDGPDDDPVHYRLRSMGGWSQSRYQRHIDKHRKEFAVEMAAAIAELVEREEANHVVLAGDEPAITPLMSALPQQTRDMVRQVTRMDIRASRDDVATEVEPILRDVEAESGASVVEQLLAELRRGSGLATVGVASVMRALSIGRVDTLVLDERADISEEQRAEVVRQAALTSADVEVVDNHEPLLDLGGGVGALLRYRL